MLEVFFIYSKPLTYSEIVDVERGIKTLIVFSVERNDWNVQFLKNKRSTTINIQYWKGHTRKLG